MIVASAPGKLMLMGEHAVLYGHPCLVAAVSARATVRLSPRIDGRILIRSELGELECALDRIEVQEPFSFVLQSVKEIGPTNGFLLDISCDFPSDVGLGSSSAITVATVGALLTYANDTADKPTVFDSALTVVRTIQGSGSGADLAAAVYGGLLHYSVRDGVLTTLPPVPLTTVYSGSKERTAVVIEKVRKAMATEPVAFEARFKAMGELVDEAASACMTGDLATLGNLMDANQTLMNAIGVSNANLDAIVQAFRHQDGIYGAKISGSGLGDCVIGLGTVGNSFAHKPLAVAIDHRGLEIDA